MSFEIQETIIVHTSLSYLSLALPLSSLCAAHLCCTIHQYAAGLHCLPQRKPGATSSLSILLVSSCDMHGSSMVSLPVKTSSNRFPTASRSVGVVSPVSPEGVVSASSTI